MATYNTFKTHNNANGTTFDFPFPTLTVAGQPRTDIKVEVNGVLKTENTNGLNNDYRISGSNVIFNSTQTGVVHIYRDTDVSTAEAVYATGSSIRATDLNLNQDQTLFAHQEVKDEQISGTKIVNGSITTEKLADRSVTEPKLADNAVITRTINNLAVTTGKLADNSVTNAKMADNAIDTAEIVNNAVTTEKIQDSELRTLAGMQSTTASNLASSTALTATTTNLNHLTGMSLAGSVTNETTKFPTSAAVVSYVAAQIASLNAFEIIANEDSFPATQYEDGVVVSISNAGGLVINSSGVASNARTVGSGSDNVTINGFPSTLYGETITDAVGLIITSTGSNQTYTYHKILANETDVKQLSDDINDFFARYRVGTSLPTTSLHAGDLFYNTSSNLFFIYNGSTSAWEEVKSTGNFFISTFSESFNGTRKDFTISNAPTYAEQILLSINGVIQKPNSGTSTPSEGFALSGSTIKLASAPPSGSNYFAVVIGESVNIGTPSDNTVSTVTLQNGAVTTDKLQNGSVTTAKIADNSITTAKIADLAVTNAKLGNTSVSTGKIQTGAVTNNKIADSSVNEAKLGTAAVTTAKIQNGSVTGSKLAQNSVGNNALGTGAVATENLQNDAVTTAKIANNSITEAKLAANSVVTNRIVDQSITNAKVNDSAAIAGTKISPDFGSQNLTTTGNLSVGSSSTDHLIHAKNSSVSATKICVESTGTNSYPAFRIVNDAQTYDLGIDGATDALRIYDVTGTAERFVVNSDGHIDITGNLDVGAGLDVTGNITVTGTVDGRDVSADGTKLDGIESNATADQTASEIVALVADQTIAPSEIDMEDGEKIKLGTSDDLLIYHQDNNSHILDNGTGDLRVTTNGAKIDFQKSGGEVLARFITDGSVELYEDGTKRFETTSTGVSVTGDINSTGDLTISSTVPTILFTDTDNNPDFTIKNDNGNLRFRDETNSSTRLKINTDGHVDVLGNLDVGAGLDVTGQITATDNLTITSVAPKIFLTDSDTNDDFSINGDGGTFRIKSETDSANRLVINSDGHTDIIGRLDAQGGLDVTGVITGTSHLDLPSDAIIKLGDNDEFQIFHQSSNGNSIIKETGGGPLSIQTNGANITFYDITNSRYMAQFITGGSCTFRHGADIRLATNSTGATVTGDLAVTGTVDGRDVAADGTKLDGIEASADVTDATNVNAAGAVMNSDLDGKGELLVGDGSGDPSALAVGTDGYILKADSSTATGLVWSAAGSGGDANQNAFSNVAVSGQTTVAADSTTDTLNLAAGSNVTITTNATNDTITIASTDTNTTYSVGDGGLTQNNFTNALKSKLDGIAAGATNFSGSYNDLTSKPSLFSGSYNDLTSKPSLFSGSYNDLTSKPTIPTNNNQLSNGAGYVTSSGNTVIGTDSDINTSGATVIDQLNMTDGVIQSHSTRTLTLGDLGYSGATNANYITNNNQLSNGAGYITSVSGQNYNSLSNKPTIPTNNNQLSNGAGYLTSVSSGNINNDAVTDAKIASYEYGNWTPTLYGNSNGASGYSIRDGSYTKIGRIVHLNFAIAITGKGSMGSGELNVGNLPYDVTHYISDTSIEASGICGYWSHVSPNMSHMTITAQQDDRLYLRHTVGAEDNPDQMLASDIDSDFTVRGSITYFN